MKPVLLLTLSFLPLFAFLTNLPLAFSNEVEQVVDTKGKPIFPGATYYIMPALFGAAGGGVKLGKTANSRCPVTVLQDFSEVVRGLPVRFKIPGISPGIIFTGTPLEIEFAWKPGCAESSKWVVFVDNEIEKACVGIGGPEDHPGQQTRSGTFHIEKYNFGYKLVFCINGSSVCLDIGRFDANNGESGRRLNLTEHEAFDLVFVEASDYEEIIKSVV
ncbi:kunitz-type trypsin inhibitor-like 2 protein [Cajanus cajan]|uniref:Kunitz-type trypsin inhibitor-like 2 protein n=1 Tax=Cajanus cajan TaxID=3821 RepID=A0A151QUI1_CAJCA|nr:kunitz-type trypsin inhibitor-like 2 protein [Cajanus cajan]KYP33981.1 Kunitz-type trypsin inhibitor-like 2 protein [Cajanus cajan]